MKSLFPVFACGLVSLAGCGASTETAAEKTAASVDSSEIEESTDSSSLPATVSAEDQLAKLNEDYTQKQNEFLAAYRAADSPETRSAAIEQQPDREEFARKFVELADTHPDSDVAVDALVWVSQNGDKATGEKAKAELLSNHSDDSKILPVVFMMVYSNEESAEPQLRGLLESSEPSVRGTARYALGSMLLRNDRSPSEAKQLLQSVLDDYSDVSIGMGRGEVDIAELAEGALFVLNNLQIGMVAPDIEGSDLDGVEFKLSDYRGKVVLLDFWGNW